MPVGIFVKGQSGAYQIDNTQKNWFVVGGGTEVSVFFSGYRPNITFLYITLSKPSKIAFATDIKIAPGGIDSPSPGQYRHSFAIYGPPAGTVVPYLIVDFASEISLPSSYVGMEIYNPATGEMTYTTYGKPAKVVDQWIETDTPSAYSTPANWSKVLASGKTYAFLSNMPMNYVHGFQTFFTNFNGGFLSISSNTVYAERQMVYQEITTSAAKHWGSISFDVLILDITGY